MKKVSAARFSPLWLSIVLLLRMGAATAQNAPILIETEKNSLVLQVDAEKHLCNAYLGIKLDRTGEYRNLPGATTLAGDYTGMYNSAYTPAGPRNLLEPAITVTHADGSQSLDLEYVSHTKSKLSPDVELLTVRLKDPAYPFVVSLFYKAYYKENVIEQWSSIEHHEKGQVILQKYASANLYLKWIFRTMLTPMTAY